MSVRLSDGLPAFGDGKQGRSLVLRMASVLLMVFGMIGVTASVFNPFGLIIAPIALISLLIVLIVHRRSTQEKFIWTLSFARDHGIEVSKVARLVATHVGKYRGKKLSLLATLLEQGAPLVDSLRRLEIRLSPAVQLSIAGSASLGNDLSSLRQTIEAEERYRQAVRNSTESGMYLLGTSLFTIGVALFLHLLIYPDFLELTQYEGGGGQILGQVAKWETALGLNGIMGLLIFLFLVSVFTSLVVLYLDVLPGNMWPISQVHSRFHRATVLASISRGLKLGQNTTAIVKLISQSHPYEEYRKMAERLHENLLRGETLEKCLLEEKIISQADQQRLSLVQSSNRLAEEMDWISKQNSLRAEMSWRVVSSWLLPLGLIFIGLGVFFLGWTVFETLNELIRVWS
jgi:type II secretory pathway component PulF